MKTSTFTSSFLAMTVLLSSSSTVIARGGHFPSAAANSDCSGNCSRTYYAKVADCQSQYAEVEKADKKNECSQDVAVKFQDCIATCK
ncbi:hypothetical protein BGZ82_006984 [Podila clonocystis]|nr:hypothetical protein BGZ82_006984 [Podila clonocystis]